MNLMARLQAVDLFEAYPDAAMPLVARHLARRAPPEGVELEEAERWPGLRLASVFLDFELVEQAGPGAYRRLLTRFAPGSFGILAPEEVRARRRGESVSLRFEQDGRAYEVEIPFDGSDWVDDAFFGILQDFFDDRPGPLEFQVPAPAGGQTARYVLATGGAYDRAAQAGLLPPRRNAGVVRPPAADVPGAARRFLRALAAQGGFDALPPALADWIRTRVAEAVARGEHPARGLLLLEAATADLRTPAQIDAAFAQFRRAAPELVPDGTTLSLTQDDAGLGYTMTLAGESYALDGLSAGHEIVDSVTLAVGVLREMTEGAPAPVDTWCYRDEQADVVRVSAVPRGVDEDLVRVPDAPKRKRR